MAYDPTTSGIPALSNAQDAALPTFLPDFGAPADLDALRDRLQDLWDRVAIIISNAQGTEFRHPERFVWETLERLNIFHMTHGSVMPTPAAIGHLHGDYSQEDFPLRPLVWDGENWVNFHVSGLPDERMLDVILRPVMVAIAAMNPPAVQAVNALRLELRGGAAEERDTLKKLSDALDVTRSLLDGLGSDVSGLLSEVPAENLIGMVPVSSIPPSVRAAPQVSIGGISDLTEGQLASIGEGSPVLLSDGRVLYYRGAGSKTDEMSYVVGADQTPVVEQLPALPISKTTGLQAALDAKAALANIPTKAMAVSADPAVNDVTIAGMIAGQTDFSLLPNEHEFGAPVIIDQVNMSIVGPSAIRAAVGDGRQATLVQMADDAPLFEVSAADFTLEKIHLRHRGADDQGLVVADRGTGASDIDLKFVDLWFDGSTGLSAPNDVISAPLVTVNGRGAEIYGGYVTAVLGPLLDITWDGITELDTDGQGFEKGPTNGMRAYRVSRVRGHGTNFTLIRNAGSNKGNISALMIDGCLCDIGGNLFEGVIRNGIISDSVVQWSKETPVKLQGGTERAIIAEIMVAGHEAAIVRRPEEMVRLEAGEYDCVRISGVAAWTRGSVIRIVGDGVGTTIVRRLIIDVAAHEIGVTAGPSYYLHASDCTIDQMDVRGVYGKNSANTAVVALKFDSCTINRLRHSLVLPSGVALVTNSEGLTAVIAGDADVGFFRRNDGGLQWSTGGVTRGGVNTAGDYGIGTATPGVRLDVRGSASLPMRLTRESASGCGFALSSHNSAGNPTSFCQIFNSPTDFTAGSEDGTLTVQVLTAGVAQTCLVADRTIIRPGNDNAATLGSASFRFSEVFAGNGAINTSDEAEKTDISEIPEAVVRAYRRISWVTYRWKDSVEKKGDGARIHFGAIAQHVKAAWEAEGLDPWAYGLLCRDELVESYEVTPERRWLEFTFDEDGKEVEIERYEPPVFGVRPVSSGNQYRLGLRYDQLFAIGCAIQAKMLDRLAALEERLGS